MSQPNHELLAVQEVLAGRYHLERELGRGGMGVVFLARDVALDRFVAVKALLPHLAEQPDLRERFLREARMAASLSHPNVVPIHIVEERGDVVLFVMAFVEGETLGQRLTRVGLLTPSVTSRIVQEVAWALAYAHRLGIVHRDIKPDNIMLEKGSGRAMVMDFGIARAASTGTMTAVPELLGTAHYMSPEQAGGEEVDGRSDLYSLGVTAFQALTGTVPFDGPSIPAVLFKQVTEPPPPLGSVRPEIPSAVCRAIDKCLAKMPEDRFVSGEALADAIAPAIMGSAMAPPQIRALMRLMDSVAEGLMFIVLMLWVFTEVEVIGNGAKLALVMVSIWPVVGLARLVRYVHVSVQDGFGFTDLEKALLQEARTHMEELLLEGPEKAAEKLAAKDRGSGRIGSWMMTLSGALLAVFELASERPPLYGGAVAAVGIVLVLSQLRRDAPQEMRALDLRERLLAGPFGRWLFRFAGDGLDHRATVPQLAAHTEVALAGAADDLFKALPVDMRERHADIPEVIKRLQADADLLRKRRDVIDQALAHGAPGRDGDRQGGRFGAQEDATTQLEASRQAVAQRLETVVAALETLRLDLLRLGVGIVAIERTTEDLARAREISDAVDAELAAHEEVSRLITN